MRLDIDKQTVKSGAHLSPSEGMCIMWPGSCNSRGYGVVSRRPYLLAHRVAWENANGLIPADLCVLHRCDTPGCVNAEHLFLGTRGDNNRDRHAKGRSRGLFVAGPTHPAVQRRGEDHWSSRLSDSDVLMIREDRRAGATVTALASRFDVHPATISRIARGIGREVLV